MFLVYANETRKQFITGMHFFSNIPDFLSITFDINAQYTNLNLAFGERKYTLFENTDYRNFPGGSMSWITQQLIQAYQQYGVGSRPAL